MSFDEVREFLGTMTRTLYYFAEQLGLQEAEWNVLTGFLTWMLVLVGIVRLVWKILAHFGPRITERRRTNVLRNSALASLYSPAEIQQAVDCYVEPDGSPLDPASEEDMRQVIPVRTPLFTTLDKYLEQGPLRKYVLLLADSGMGKTAFLVNYFARHQLAKGKGNKASVCLVPLNSPSADEEIRRLQNGSVPGINPKDATILLDALDEDRAAQEDYRSRLTTLMQSCSKFKNVVVTCRTQFFRSDEEIPKEPGVALVSPTAAGDSGTYKFNKLYIAPFSNEQVKAYIKRRFPIWRFRKRRDALKLASQIAELSVRPMLLGAIPAIVKGRIDATRLSNLYDFLTEGWL